MVRKQYLTIGIYKILEFIVKLSVFNHFFSEKSNFRSQQTKCVPFYDDVIDRDVT